MKNGQVIVEAILGAIVIISVVVFIISMLVQHFKGIV